MEKYNLEIKENGVYINETLINEKIFQNEMHEYKVIEREDQIDHLIDWISEAIISDNQNGLYAMKEDLKYLINLKDKYLFSSISTNNFEAKSDDGENVISEDFKIICEELLELNNLFYLNEEVREQIDYCSSCKEYINQIDLGDGSFGCPICKSDNSIEIR